MTSPSNSAKSKIKVSIGNTSFSGSGNHEWLAEQLDKVLKIAANHPASLEPPSAKSVATPLDTSSDMP